MTRSRRLTSLLLTAALAGGGVLSAAPAHARVDAARPLGAAAPCKRAAAGERVPVVHRERDTPPVTAGARVALTRVAGPRAGARNPAVVLPRQVRIPVRVHVIRGTRPGEHPNASRARLHQWIGLLNRGFAGRQVAGGESTRYHFALAGVDHTTREAWWHASSFDARDTQMKQALHVGSARTLNLYITGGPRDLLGWSRFPWQYAQRPRLDGVTITRKALPGGGLPGYDLGDTLIHETGHWLGLLHTFQGGCTGAGDLVADTPAEASPSYYCDESRDTCPSPGSDPVHNFMDYSPDRCMDTFTPGQAVRMDRAWLRWRAP